MSTVIDQNPHPPMWRDLVRPAHLVHSVVLGGGVVLHAMNVFVSATIMPSVIEEIGGLSYYSWSTTVFVMMSIVGAALTARAIHIGGPRNAYLFAFALFSLGSALCAMAANIGIYNAGRAIQGLGGGFLYALAYTVIRAVFSERLWPIAVGLVTLMWGAATLVGPAIGGVFAELGAWRGAFWTLIGAALLLSLLCLRALPHRAGNRSNQNPIAWKQLLILLAIIAVISIGSASASKAFLVPLFLVAAVGVWLLILTELSAKARLLPATTYAARNPLGLLYGCVACLLIGMQPEAFVPYFLQVLKGLTPLMAGYIGALMALGWTLAATISAKFTGPAADRTLIIGSILSLTGLAVQIAFVPGLEASSSRLFAIAFGLILVGFGIGYCWPHLTTRIFLSAAREEQDVAAAAVTTVQLVATALGAALAGLTVNLSGMTAPGATEGASSAAFWLFTIFLLAPALSALFALRLLKTDLKKGKSDDGF